MSFAAPGIGSRMGAGRPAVRPAVLYLDFDGCLHPEPVHWHPARGAYLRKDFVATGHKLFEHAPLLEALLVPYPDVRIVLSTRWVQQYGFAGTARRLPPGLTARCIGATFHSKMDKQLFDDIPRGLQVMADVGRRRPAAWLAIDDTDEGWNTTTAGHVVLTHAVQGIAHPEVLPVLKQRLAERFSLSRGSNP